MEKEANVKGADEMDPAFKQGMLAGMEYAACVFREALSEDNCESCKSPWRYDGEREEFVNPFQRLKEAHEKLEPAR